MSIYIGDIPEGTVFSFDTENSVITAIDREKGADLDNPFLNQSNPFILDTEITLGGSVTKNYTNQKEPILVIFDESLNQVSIRMALKWWVAPSTEPISAIQLFFTNIYFTNLISSTTNAEGLDNFYTGRKFHGLQYLQGFGYNSR